MQLGSEGTKLSPECPGARLKVPPPPEPQAGLGAPGTTSPYDTLGQNETVPRFELGEWTGFGGREISTIGCVSQGALGTRGWGVGWEEAYGRREPISVGAFAFSDLEAAAAPSGHKRGL